MWKYDLADWHEGLGLSHEQSWGHLLADGWEPDGPESVEGSVIELNGRRVLCVTDTP
jgi:hypothetical protein